MFEPIQWDYPWIHRNYVNEGEFEVYTKYRRYI